MNKYQVILQNSDILSINADSAARDGCYLNFYEGDIIKAQFSAWQGWNLVGPVESPPRADRTPVSDLPTGRE